MSPLIGERIVDRQRGTAGQILGKGQVAFRVMPSGFGEHERHGADDAAWRHNRHAHVRREPERLHNPQPLRIRHTTSQHLR